MDVWGVFVGDSTLSYGGSVRSTYYRDFEQFPYGTLEQNNSPNSKDSYSRVQEKCKQMKNEKDQRKDCPFCKEQKKRPLINYLRKRDFRKHHESICEDEEEELNHHQAKQVEEQEHAQQQEQEQHNNDDDDEKARKTAVIEKLKETST